MSGSDGSLRVIQSSSDRKRWYV